MHTNGVSFSIARHSAWAPGICTPEAWDAWSKAPFAIEGEEEPRVREMPAMLRRRAGLLGKMALEVAYQCLDGRTGVPTVFCSRHGEVGRAVDLLTDLARGEPLSPAGFGLAVHNASAGLFSIARADHASHVALAAGDATIEHGVIEACGLLADGAPLVMLVAYDCGLPPLLAHFEDCAEQPHAWAWLMAPPAQAPIRLGWDAAASHALPPAGTLPGGLEVLRFHLSGAPRLRRTAAARHWTWSRDD